MPDQTLTQDRLRDLLSYDPESGEFRWRKSFKGSVRAGDRAGCLDKHSGYWVIKVDRKTYGAHRLAWLYVHGQWPGGIDHRGRVRSDNRLSQLRAATSSENNRNRSVSSRSQSGLKGAAADDQSVRRKKWRARIRVNGKNVCLGRYATAEEAHAAYEAAAKKYFGEFAHA